MSVKIARPETRANFNVESKIVLSLSRNRCGYTPDDLSLRLGVDLGAIERALKKLSKKKIVHNSGETRKTTRGHGYVYTRRKGPPAPPPRDRGLKW